MSELIFKEFVESIERTNDDIGWGIWDYSDYGVREVCAGIYNAKRKLRETLSKHPNWNEERQMIIFSPTDFEGDVDEWVCDKTCDYLLNALNKIHRELHKTQGNENPLGNLEEFNNVSEIMKALVQRESYELSRNGIDDSPYSSTVSDEAIKHLNEKMQSTETLKGIRFGIGMKRSKAVQKIVMACGIDKLDGEIIPVIDQVTGEILSEKTVYPWDKVRAEYGDAINPIHNKYWVCISINPVDFWNISHGNKWDSCLNPNMNYANGCSCSGGISHGLDDTTVVVYAVKEDFDGEDFEMQEKEYRSLFFVHPDCHSFVQAKVYPDNNEGLHRGFREIFEKALAECLGEPNIWGASNEYRKYASLNKEATPYSDLWYDTRIAKYCWIKSVEKPCKTIRVGEAPICIECGCRHHMRNNVNCCHKLNEDVAYVDGYEEDDCCKNCGAEVGEYSCASEVWSDYHNCYGCTDCMREFGGDWYIIDDFNWVEVNGLGEEAPEEIIREDDKYFYCDYCEEWYYCGNGRYDYLYDEEYGCVCTSCYDEIQANRAEETFSYTA